MLQDITVLGVANAPEHVLLQGQTPLNWVYLGNLRRLSITNITLDLNEPQVIQWI